MTDVLAPPLIWVEGECYRFYENPVWFSEIPIACSQKPSLQKAGDYVYNDEASSSESESMVHINRKRYGLDSSFQEEGSCDQDSHVEDMDSSHEEGSCNYDICAESTDGELRETGSNNQETDRQNAKTLLCEEGSSNQKSLPKDANTVPCKQSSQGQEFPSGKINVVHLRNDKYLHTFSFPTRVGAKVMGQQGCIIKSVQRNTRTSIDVVRGQEICTTMILGASIKAVTLARRKLDSIIDAAKRRSDVKSEIPVTKLNVDKKLYAYKPSHFPVPKFFTHFLSIPINEKHIGETFISFKKSVLADAARHPKGVRGTQFQNRDKLHINLGMLSLLNEEAIKAAVQALEECNETIIKPIIIENGPIKILLERLYTPHVDVMTNVIYSKVSSKNDALDKLVEKIVVFFVDKGLMTKPHSNPRLLVTLINSKLGVPTAGRGSEMPKPFYARQIFKRHFSRYFGEKVLTTIHLSKHKSYDENGYYKAESIIRVSD